MPRFSGEWRLNTWRHFKFLACYNTTGMTEPYSHQLKVLRTSNGAPCQKLGLLSLFSSYGGGLTAFFFINSRYTSAMILVCLLMTDPLSQLPDLVSACLYVVSTCVS